MDLSSLEQYRVRAGLDIFVVPDFAQTELNVDPGRLLLELEDKYPMRRADDCIEHDAVQWVGGEHKALHYRGHPIKRKQEKAERANKYYHANNIRARRKQCLYGVRKGMIPSKKTVVKLDITLKDLIDNWSKCDVPLSDRQLAKFRELLASFMV